MKCITRPDEPHPSFEPADDLWVEENSWAVASDPEAAVTISTHQFVDGLLKRIKDLEVMNKAQGAELVLLRNRVLDAFGEFER